jgi:hypothetical protein
MPRRAPQDRDVNQLFGFDFLDRWAALFYSLPTTNPGRIVPAGCVVGPGF